MIGKRTETRIKKARFSDSLTRFYTCNPDKLQNKLPGLQCFDCIYNLAQQETKIVACRKLQWFVPFFENTTRTTSY